VKKETTYSFKNYQSSPLTPHSSSSPFTTHSSPKKNPNKHLQNKIEIVFLSNNTNPV
jgi:hypothetical protein